MDFKKVSRESQVLQGNIQQDENVQVSGSQELHYGEQNRQSEQPADRLMNQNQVNPNLNQMRQGMAQDGALGQVKGRNTWSGTSITGEKKKTALKDEKKEVHKDQRFDKIRRQVHKAMQPKKYRTLYEILGDIMEKQTLSGILAPLLRLEATVETSDSGAFTDMVTKTRTMMNLFDRCYGQASHDYQEAFVEAKKAVDIYLQEHKGHRWSGKGKERKKYAKELKAQFEALEIPLCKMMLETKTTEMGDCENNSTYVDMANAAQFSILDQTPYINEYTDKRVEELVKNGTMSAKMKALFEMNIFNEYRISHKGLLEENGRSFDQKQLNQKMDAIMDSINKSSPMEQLNAIDEIVSMQTVIVHQLMDNYATYVREAPLGTDSHAYAILKLRSSSLGGQQDALVSMMRSMGNGDGTDAASQVQAYAQKRIEGAYPDQALLKRVFDDVFKKPVGEFVTAVGGNTYKEIAREQMKQETERLLSCNMTVQDKKSKNRRSVDVDKYVNRQMDEIIFNSRNAQFLETIRKEDENINQQHQMVRYREFFAPTQEAIREVQQNGTFEDKINMLFNLSVSGTLQKPYADYRDSLLKNLASAGPEEKSKFAVIVFRLNAHIKNANFEAAKQIPGLDIMTVKTENVLYEEMIRLLKEAGADDIIAEVERFTQEYSKTHKELAKKPEITVADRENMAARAKQAGLTGVPYDAELSNIMDWERRMKKDETIQKDIQAVKKDVRSQFISGDSKRSAWKKEAKTGSVTGLLKQYFGTAITRKRFEKEIRRGGVLYDVTEPAMTDQQFIAFEQELEQETHESMVQLALKDAKNWDRIMATTHELVESAIDETYQVYQSLKKEAPDVKGVNPEDYAKVKLYMSWQWTDLTALYELALKNDTKGIRRAALLHAEIRNVIHAHQKQWSEMMVDEAEAKAALMRLPAAPKEPETEAERVDIQKDVLRSWAVNNRLVFINGNQETIKQKMGGDEEYLKKFNHFTDVEMRCEPAKIKRKKLH